LLSYTVHLFYRHMAQNFRLSRYSRLLSFLYASCSKDMLRYAFPGLNKRTSHSST